MSKKQKLLQNKFADARGHSYHIASLASIHASYQHIRQTGRLTDHFSALYIYNLYSNMSATTDVGPPEWLVRLFC